MPAKLDRSVKQVTKQLMQDKGLSKDDAESRAWAICRARLKMQFGYDVYEALSTEIVNLCLDELKRINKD